MTKVKSFQEDGLVALEIKIENFINSRSEIKVISLAMSSVLYPESYKMTHYAILIYE